MNLVNALSETFLLGLSLWIYAFQIWNAGIFDVHCGKGVSKYSSTSYNNYSLCFPAHSSPLHVLVSNAYADRLV